jgi:hypothetical protein
MIAAHPMHVALAALKATGESEGGRPCSISTFVAR